MAHQRRHLLGAIRRVQRAQHPTHQRDAPISDQVFRDVGELDGDDIALAQAVVEQRVGEAERGVPRLGMAHTAVGSDDRGLIRQVGGAGAKPVADHLVGPVALFDETALDLGRIARLARQIDHRTCSSPSVPTTAPSNSIIASTTQSHR